MSAFGLAARWAHLVCGLGLVGIFGASLLAGRSDRPTARQWASRTIRLSIWLVTASLVLGFATLAHQLIVVSGHAGALLDPAMWRRLILESRFGTVWLVRHALLVLLAALVLFRDDEEESALDWTAWRLQASALGAVALAAMAWAGHAVAMESLGAGAVLADAAHLVAAGFWLGTLPPLALLLRAASREAGADARPYAVLAVRRFSTVALGAMLLIALTGTWNAWVELGGVPALVGTRYGRLLLVKIALLNAVLGIAIVNRRRLLPALSLDGATVGRPAMARLSRFLTWELALGLLMVLIAAALSLTIPGIHDTVWWPFSYRLSYDAVAALPGTNARLLIGSQVAFVGLLALVVALMRRRHRDLMIGFGVVALVTGLWIALPPLAVDAYPTTYRRSPLPYEAQSIARGVTLYAERCALCHGRDGMGDGPGGAGLPRIPADLTAPHTAQHTAGDLFWWITHGIKTAGMPPFSETLDEDQRWDLINFLRALSAGEQARRLTPVVERDGPRLVAPDFGYAVGPAPPQRLKDLRGRRVALVVLFALPESRARMERLAETYLAIELAGGEIIAVPMSADPSIIGQLGAKPPIFFPVVTDGAAEIVATYLLFSRTPDSPAPPRHVEFLVDRQGYLRARWSPDSGGPGWSDIAALRAQIRALDQERLSAAPPSEHVH